MQLKWIEDFLALAETGSLSRAAELRSVTHPAFGRRIQALETWAGTALIERGRNPVRLTPAGALFRDTAAQLAASLRDSRLEMQSEAGRQARSVSFATGRTLARTILADLLVRLRPVLREAEVRIATASLADTARRLERNETDFMLGYHHPLLAVRLDGRQFQFATLASDKLVPVSRADAAGAPLYPVAPGKPVPLLAYARSLALGRLLEDHLSQHRAAPLLVRRIECDSADALNEYVLKGLGVAWLPWSMVAADCRRGVLVSLGGRSDEIAFEVRLYRSRARLADLAEAAWEATANRKA